MTTTFPNVGADWAPTINNQPRLLETNFGDGYTQRVADGANSQLRQVQLKFSNLPQADRDTVVNFLEARGGIESFFYTLPGQSVVRLWRAKTWTESPMDKGYYSLSVNLNEEPDPF